MLKQQTGRSIYHLNREKMSIMASILGGLIGHKITSYDKVTSTAVEVIDTLFTSDEERFDKKAILARIEQQAAALQTAINRTEARHRSVFVAGWRPFIGWVCGMALFWHFVVLPCLHFILASLAIEALSMPQFDMSELNTILFGLLGLGTLRTAEKAAGRA